MKFVHPDHHMIKNGHLTNCQICNSNKMHLILDLGNQPLCDSLLTKEKLYLFKYGEFLRVRNL